MQKIAIVGAGRISKRHIEAIAELEASGTAMLEAVCEVDEGRLAQVTAPNKFPDIASFVNSGLKLDLIAVLTPSGLHYQHALELLQLSTPVLVEKPLTLSFAQAMTLTAEFESANVPLFVVKQNRLNDSIQDAVRVVNSGDLGELCFVTASVLWSRDADYYLADQWRLRRDLDGGVVWNQASHYVDLLVQFLGPMDSVSAHGRNFLSPADTEDTVFATMTSKSEKIGSLHATTTIRPQNFEGSLTISGDKGLVRVGGHALNKIEYVQGISLGLAEDGAFERSNVYGASHGRVYADILADLAGGAQSQFRASKTLEVVKLMAAIELGVAEKRLVFLDEF